MEDNWDTAQSGEAGMFFETSDLFIKPFYRTIPDKESHYFWLIPNCRRK